MGVTGEDDLSLPGVNEKTTVDPLESVQELIQELMTLDQKRAAALREANPDFDPGPGISLKSARENEIKELGYIITRVGKQKVVKDPVTKQDVRVDVIDNQKLKAYLNAKYYSIAVAGTKGAVIWLWNGKQFQRDNGMLHKDITRTVDLFNQPTQRTLVAEIISMLQGTNFYDKTPFNTKTGWLPVENGVLSINYKTGEIRHYLDHDPELMNTFCLPVRYDENAPTEPVLEVLSSWVDKEDVDTLIQIPAQGLIQAQFDRTFKKSYLLQGEPNSGKSTYIGGRGLLGRFCGDDSSVMSQVSLHQITSNEFSLSELENRVLNCYDDLNSEELRNYGIFKNVTGATRHGINVKHQSSYTGRIHCVHVFTCNIPPRVPDIVMVEPAFWNRWEFVSFPNEHKIKPGWADETFTPKFMSGFLNLVIKKMIEIVRNDNITTVHSPDEVMDMWTLAADPLKQFIESETTETDAYNKPYNTRVHYDKKLLFNYYNEFFTENKFDERKRIKTLDGFSKTIQTYGFIRDKVVLNIPGAKKNPRVPSFSSYRRWKSGMAQVEPSTTTLPD